MKTKNETNLVCFDRDKIIDQFGNHNCLNISRYAKMKASPLEFSKYDSCLRSQIRQIAIDNFAMYVSIKYIYNFLCTW